MDILQKSLRLFASKTTDEYVKTIASGEMFFTTFSVGKTKNLSIIHFLGPKNEQPRIFYVVDLNKESYMFVSSFRSPY